MEQTRSPNDAQKGYLKTWDWWNCKSFLGHCPWTPPGGEGGGLQYPMQTPSCNAINFNPSWKMDVSKNAWIKPWYGASKDLVCKKEVIKCNNIRKQHKKYELWWDCERKHLNWRQIPDCPYRILIMEAQDLEKQIHYFIW